MLYIKTVCNLMHNVSNQWRKFSFRGGGAKLHEFPTTLHRFASFTIAYCFTKTTLGQYRGRDSACNAIIPFSICSR